MVPNHVRYQLRYTPPSVFIHNAMLFYNNSDEKSNVFPAFFQFFLLSFSRGFSVSNS